MPLLIDSFNKLIKVTAPTTDVDAQTLHDFTQDYLATPRGMVEDGLWDQRGEILKPEGKIEDPSQPGVFSQIILIFNPQWQIQFWQGSGYSRIYGGKIVGGVADEPMKATGLAGDITVLESPVDGLAVATGGSGLTPEQAQQIKDIYKLLGLDRTDSVTVTPAGADSASGDIEIDFTGDGVSSTTMERQ